jgi:hypothetical protein
MRNLLSYFVQIGQFERCYMKACAFLHTCAVHITLDYSAAARLWGTTNHLEHHVSGGVKIPLLFLLIFIS